MRLSRYDGSTGSGCVSGNGRCRILVCNGKEGARATCSAETAVAAGIVNEMNEGPLTDSVGLPRACQRTTVTLCRAPAKTHRNCSKRGGRPERPPQAEGLPHCGVFHN